MNKVIFHVVKALSLCATLWVSSVSAQVNHMLVVNVPFDFTAIDKQFSAGTYTLTSATLQSPIFIRGSASGSPALILPQPAQAAKTPTDAKLIFHRYGNRYFLRNIWYPGTEYGRELSVSTVEQQFARTMPEPEKTVLLVFVAESKEHKRSR